MCKDSKQNKFASKDKIKICPCNYLAVAALDRFGFLKPSQHTINVVEHFIKDLITEWGLELTDKNA